MDRGQLLPRSSVWVLGRARACDPLDDVERAARGLRCHAVGYNLGDPARCAQPPDSISRLRAPPVVHICEPIEQRGSLSLQPEPNPARPDAPVLSAPPPLSSIFNASVKEGAKKA